MALLDVTDLRKGFRAPDGQHSTVIDIAQFRLDARTQVALRGASGSGKTTLLHLLAGILAPDSGRIIVDGREVGNLSEPQRDRWRAQTVGYVFQTFNLLPAFSCVENVLLGMAFGSRPDRSFAEQLLHRVGLADRMHYRPGQLSTGQQQRVAVARALGNRPQIVLADEPTGNLDPMQARAALDLIREICTEAGTALLLVSHDPTVLNTFENVVELRDINRAAARSDSSP